MTDAILAILIVLPLIGATLPLVAGLFRRRTGWPITVLLLSVEAILAGWLTTVVYRQDQRLVHVLGGESFGRKTIEIGGQSTENFIVGIELVGDAFSAGIALLVAVVALAALAFARTAGPRRNAFYSGYLLLAGGLMGIVLTGDLFNLFVFLEITGLTTYGLVAADRSPRSALAALKYLLVGTVGASLYLLGVGYVFLRTGTLNMVDIARSLAGEPAWIESPLYSDPLIIASFGFIAVGLFSKAAIFPLHIWQPDAYQQAPDTVTIYISALVSTTAAYAIGRVMLTVYTPSFFAATPAVLTAVYILASASVILGSVLAAMQQSVKRMFAYSSVAQFGLIVIAFGVAVDPASPPAAVRYAVAGAVIHLLGHGVIKGGLFATVGAIATGDGSRTVDAYAGLAKRRPVLAGGLAVLGFALVGVPPTVGFIAKWYMALGAANAQSWLLVAVIVASTLVSLLYVARLVEKCYFDYPPDGAPTHAEPSPVPATGDLTPEEMATDGGHGEQDHDQQGVLTAGMYALVAGSAILSVVLGFLGADLATLFEPIAEAAIDSRPEVIVNE